MKIWITKHALTKGIYTDEIELQASDDTVIAKSPGGYLRFFSKGEWHETKSAAVAEAKEMIIEELKCLNVRISRLQAMTFE